MKHSFLLVCRGFRVLRHHIRLPALNKSVRARPISALTVEIARQRRTSNGNRPVKSRTVMGAKWLPETAYKRCGPERNPKRVVAGPGRLPRSAIARRSN